MDEATRNALEASIVKWELYTRADNVDEITLGREFCPLCLLSDSLTSNKVDICQGCPVFARTRRHGCCGTPYHEVAELVISEAPIEKVRQAAFEELKFLRSLLPEDEVSVS